MTTRKPHFWHFFHDRCAPMETERRFLKVEQCRQAHSCVRGEVAHVPPLLPWLTDLALEWPVLHIYPAGRRGPSISVLAEQLGIPTVTKNAWQAIQWIMFGLAAFVSLPAFGAVISSAPTWLWGQPCTPRFSILFGKRSCSLAGFI